MKLPYFITLHLLITTCTRPYLRVQNQVLHAHSMTGRVISFTCVNLQRGMKRFPSEWYHGFDEFHYCVTTGRRVSSLLTCDLGNLILCDKILELPSLIPDY